MFAFLVTGVCGLAFCIFFNFSKTPHGHSWLAEAPGLYWIPVIHNDSGLNSQKFAAHISLSHMFLRLTFTHLASHGICKHILTVSKFSILSYIVIFDLWIVWRIKLWKLSMHCIFFMKNIHFYLVYDGWGIIISQYEKGSVISR